MNLLLDVISPIPEFTVIHDNKSILSKKIVKFEKDKLSDNIFISYQDIDKKLDLTNKLESLIVTLGPGSYTSLRVGISFMLGLHYSKNIKILGITIKEMLNFLIKLKPDLNAAFYVISANNQEFVCIKSKYNQYEYVKLENNIFNEYNDIQKADVIYYNDKPLNILLNKCEQIKCSITNNILSNYINLEFNNSEILRPIYVSNNKKLS